VLEDRRILAFGCHSQQRARRDQGMGPTVIHVALVCKQSAAMRG
jgi:hypothetical protein